MSTWEQIEKVRERVREAAERVGRSPSEIELMAVTKTRPVESAKEAAQGGITLFGENRVQEAVEKFSSKESHWNIHLIGHLQSNKAAKAARFFDMIHSVDTVLLAEKISAARGNSPLPILLQVNVAKEETKSGIKSVDELLCCCRSIAKLPGVQVRGTMTIAPFTDNEKIIREVFRTCCCWHREMVDEFNIEEPILSMGMSNDYTVAVEEGSTLIRVGSSLFGERL